MAIVEQKGSSLSFLTDNAITSTINEVYAGLADKRKAMGLINPGTVEGISREVQRDVLLTNHMFSGLRCDLQKIFSINPLFRLQHGFAMGSQALPPWNFLCIYGTNRVFMQGSFSGDGSVTTWGNLRWNDRLITKTQAQIGGDPRSSQTMVQLENEYTGEDFTASIKAMNPSIMEGGLTGIFIGQYLQSITPKLSLGIEGVYQRASLGTKPETAASYSARYKTDDWIASGQILAAGQFNVAYWRKLTDKVEAGVDCNLQFMPGMNQNMFGGPQKEGTTVLGLKYNFANSVYRAQVDSAGKLGVVLERRVAPPVSLTFAAEIDQVKNTHKLGLAVSIDGAPEELEEISQRVESAVPPFG